MRPSPAPITSRPGVGPLDSERTERSSVEMRSVGTPSIAGSASQVSSVATYSVGAVGVPRDAPLVADVEARVARMQRARLISKFTTQAQYNKRWEELKATATAMTHNVGAAAS